MSSSMKHPKPERLVVMEGIPMTVHSAGVLKGREGKRERGEGEASEVSSNSFRRPSPHRAPSRR